MRRAMSIAALCSVVLSSTVSAADVADVKQTISDLRSQLADKQRFDKRGAARLELSQIGAWLDQAANALKEEATDRARRVIQRVRAQFKLVDQLVARSELQAKKASLGKKLAQLRRDVEKKRELLANKRAKIEALRGQNK